MIFAVILAVVIVLVGVGLFVRARNNRSEINSEVQKFLDLYGEPKAFHEISTGLSRRRARDLWKAGELPQDAGDSAYEPPAEQLRDTLNRLISFGAVKHLDDDRYVTTNTATSLA
jgi:hypothetical protein